MLGDDALHLVGSNGEQFYTDSARHRAYSGPAEARKYLSLALGEAVRRREFVSLLGGAAVAYPLAVRAQPSDQLRRVAVLGDSPSTWKVWIAGFAERLRELGWIEDRTIAIEYH